MRLIASLMDFFGSIFFHFKAREIGEINKIVVLKFDRLGDTFLSLPVISGLRQNFPDAKIVVLAAPWNKEVLENNPDIDRLVVVDNLPDVHGGIKGFFSGRAIDLLARLIESEQPDMGVDLQGSPLNVLALYRAKVKIRVGFSWKVFSFLLTHKTQYNLSGKQARIYLSLLTALSLPVNDVFPRLYPNLAEKARVNDWSSSLAANRLVVFHLGAGRSYRLWSIEKFAELAELILKAGTDFKIIIFGDETEEGRVIEFKKLLSPELLPRIIDISGQFNFREFYYLLSQAHSFVGNDSAPARLAGALNIPAVCIFNPWSGVERFGIEGQRTVLVYKTAHVCAGQYCHLSPCPNMLAVEAREVFNSWREINNMML